MRLTANWHSTWKPWTEYRCQRSDQTYNARSRALYIGRLHIATLCQSTLRPREPFYMYSTGAPALTVRGTTAFRVVRQFMRQLRHAN